MPKRKPEKKERLTEAAEFFGVSYRTLARWQEIGCPCRGGPYDLFLIAEWWAENVVAPKLLAAEKKSIENAQDEASLDSELKRRRIEQQLRSEELDYAERIGELLPRSHTSVVFDTVAAQLRKAGELLQKQFGDDAQLVVLESIDAMERILSEHFDDRKAVKR